MHTTRRTFLKTSGLWAGSLATAQFHALPRAASSHRRYKAAIIGRTGRGDYGHGFDVIFRGLENVTVEAIADENEEGLRKAAGRSGAKRQYLDFRQMLEKEKPDLVSIAPRHPDGHQEMALAAIEAGAHIYMEKPMTETVAEADAIVAAAEKKGIKIALGHVRRYTPEFRRMKELWLEGFLGTVLEARVQGKQDRRAGGEDLIVLGTHDFDLIRWLAGDPLWCFATVYQDGREATRQDVRKGQEPILVAGNTIRASYAFPNNLQFHWRSVKTDDHWNDRFSDRDKWTFEIFGTKRIMLYHSGYGTVYLDSPFLAHKSGEPKWLDLPEPKKVIPDHETHPVKNLIHAIETDTQPLCSAKDGRWTIEMVSAVYQSHARRSPVPFPLTNRENPFALWK